jgi:pimeloyl-ACP methyl ester carboxylesterase
LLFAPTLAPPKPPRRRSAGSSRSAARVHYVERGQGEPLVLLHGNGMMIQDFLSSDFLTLAATHYRVIMFDRPGYGYNDRSRTTVWTPEAQADLLHNAFARIGIRHYLALGHSGTVHFIMRVGGKALELQPGKAAISIGSLDKLPGVVDALITAVRAGELDPQIKEAAAARGLMMAARRKKAA